ncbi:MAG: DUF4255 domain-containing protein [Ferruginibacter sp.]
MIDKALQFLTDELDAYLHIKLPGVPAATNLVVLDNIAKLQDNAGGGSLNRIILSLVNIEEDTISKNPENFYRTDDNRVVYKNSPVHLNLYCLFAYNHGEADNDNVNHYETALQYISYVIRFFQHRNFFTQANSPSLDIKIEKLVTELYTLGFEQLNHLWAVLGGKYMPSALYKIRLVVVEEDLVTGIGEVIRNVNVDNN